MSSSPSGSGGWQWDTVRSFTFSRLQHEASPSGTEAHIKTVKPAEYCVKRSERAWSCLDVSCLCILCAQRKNSWQAYYHSYHNVFDMWRSPHDHTDGVWARNLTWALYVLHSLVVTVTTRPSSHRSPCRTRHAPGSLTPSRWCPSQPWLRATTDAGGGVSPSPSTSRSARPTATVLKMDAQSESPSESACSCVPLCLCVCLQIFSLCRFPGHHESFKGLSWRLLDYF